MSSRKKKNNSQEKFTRIAVINPDKCKPKKCNLECMGGCPVNLMGKVCIEVSSQVKIASLSESLCIGCGICVKKCPFNAISIINIPSGLKKDLIHQYGENGFRIHRLPLIKPNTVLGLIGRNGTGKSTAMKILSGKICPNMGEYNGSSRDLQNIIDFYKGSALQKYFKELKEKNIKVVLKPQYVMQLKAKLPGKVKDYIKKSNQMDNPNLILEKLELVHLLEREVKDLSGGECQRFAIAICIIQKKDMYIFDEPTSYLDVKQRIVSSQVIRSIFDNFPDKPSKYVIAVEHDLAILDYLSDQICCMYGQPSAYGVVSMPFNVRDGINIYLKGYIPNENMRFRSEEFTFKLKTEIRYEEEDKLDITTKYKNHNIILSGKNNKFELEIKAGQIKQGDTIVLLGENGTGKSTFCDHLSKLFEGASYKKQNVMIEDYNSVKMYMQKKIGNMMNESIFINDIWKPLEMENIKDNLVEDLSGGELQRVAICECLGKDTDLYILDEPCAFLDCEQRINLARVIKRFVLNNKKQAIVVEHDLSMCTFIADKVILFEGEPGIKCIAGKPSSLKDGMNSFLKNINVTFRKDDTTHRPRINKLNSMKDTEQKKNGNYFIF
jgi:ATP-binding cassette, sub-family E, member 1